MNEQNNNVTGTNPSQSNAQSPSTNPTPTPSVMENINTIKPEAVPQAAPSGQEVAPAAAPQVAVQPAQAASEAQAVPAQPAATPTPTPVPAQAPAPTPTPVPATTPAPTPTPVEQPAPAPEANAEPVATLQPSGTVSTGNGTFGPSKPMSSDADLTNIGFVAASDDLPKKKSKVPLIITIIVLIILGVVGYFVVYPYVLKTFFNDPMNVYTTTIDSAFRGINTSINEVVHEKAIYDIELSLDSNLEVLKPYSGYKYGVNFGIDPNKKNLQLGYAIKTPTNLEYSAYSYIKDNKTYERYSTYRDESGKTGLIYTGETNSQEVSDLFSSFQGLINNYDKVNNDDLNYLVDKLSKTISGSIDENKLSKEDASITLNGESLKVTNNKYVLDLDNKRRTVKYVIDAFKDDDKALEIFAKLTDGNKDEIKKALEEINVDEVITEDDTLYISIYTYGNKNTIIGYAITDAKEEVEFHYYSKDKGFFEAYIYSVEDNEETGKREESKIDIKGVDNADGHKITVSVNGEEAIILDIKAWDEKTKEFDYTIKDKDGDYTGTVKYTKDLNDERLKVNFDFSIKVSKDENLSIGLAFTEDWSSEVANINTSATGSVVNLTETEIADVRNRFNTELYNSTPLGTFFQTVSGMYEPGINEYYDTENNITPEENTDNPTPVVPENVTNPVEDNPNSL